MPAFKINVVHKRDNVDGEYVGRPSTLGNPFTIGRDGTRNEVIAKYRVWLWNKILGGGEELKELDRLGDKFIANRGLTLVCWCAPQACHADVIASAIEWRSNP